MTNPIQPPDDLPGGSYRTEPIGWIEQHLAWMRRNGCADSTLKTRRATLTRLAEHLGHDPATATVDELEAWQDTLPSQTSIRHQTHLIRPYYRWLHQRGHRADDPAAGLATPRRSGRMPRPIPEANLMRALDTAPERLRPWLLLAGWCGLRAAEIAALDVRQFHHDDDGRVWLRVAGKNNRERDVPVPDWVWQRVAPCLPASGPCWTRQRGHGPVTAQHVSQYCSEHLRASGVPDGVTFHSLRHRAATQLLDASSGDLRLVQHYLGHADLSTVHVYTQVRAEHTAAAGDRLPRPADAPTGDLVAIPGGRNRRRIGEAELAQHVDEWLSQHSSPDTRTAYRLDTRQWLGWCTTERLDPLLVRRPHCDRYRQWMEAPPTRGVRRRYAPATVARRMASLASLYEHLVTVGVLEVNPVGKTQRPRRPDVMSVGMALDEARAYLAAADTFGPLESALAWLMLSTGLRVAEVCKLDTSDLRTEWDTLVVDVYRKGGRTRRIVIPEPAAGRMRRWLELRPKHPTAALWVFKGARIRDHQVTQIVERTRKRAGVRTAISPHSLRHTAATLALDSGIPLREVQELMGHSNPGQTQRYDHARQNLQQSAAIRLGALLAAS